MLRSRNFRKPVVTTINKRINQECKSISKRLSISPFRLKCMKSLKSFKMRVLVKYFKKKAPYLSRCLKAAANGDFSNMVTTAGSILLTSRNKDLCSLQAVISIIMYAGHCSKLTFTRLNKLGLCLSHSRSIELVKELGVDHNRQVLKWKQKLETAGTDIPGGESPQSNPSTDTIPVQESSECSSALTFSSVDKGSSSSSCKSDTGPISDNPTFIITGDNLDKTINPRFMTSEHQRKSLHFFHTYAVLDRVKCSHLPSREPIGDLMSVPITKYLPHAFDCQVLCENYAVHLARVLVKDVLYFRKFQDCVERHIPHAHSVEVAQPSHIVPLGVIPKNENKTEEMISIIEDLHQYVAHDIQVPFAGDLLTAVRARQVLNIRVNSSSFQASLRGLKPFACDWHAKVNYMSIMWERLYKPGSSREGGTLNQLRNVINRKNVSDAKGKDVKNNVNAIEDFLVLTVECHLIAAALNHFGMSDMDDHPRSNGFPENVGELSLQERKQLFQSEIRKIIKKYVVPQAFVAYQDLYSHSTRIKLEHSYCRPPSSSRSSYMPNPIEDNELNRNPHISRIHSDHCYQLSVAPPQRRRFPQSLTQYHSVASASQAVKKAAVDGINDYASTVLADGLLLLEFKDAIREGDGLRILRCWKVFLMYFTYARHQNYQHEAFHTLSLVNAVASPRVASQITWGRVVNVSGGAGHNVPLDIHMEHLNRTVKDYVASLGANVAERSIIQCGKSLGGISTVTQKFDKDHSVLKPLGTHSSPQLDADKATIIRELCKESRVFDYIPGRQHNSFSGIKPNIANCIDKSKLVTLLHRKKIALQKNVTLAKIFGHKV